MQTKYTKKLILFSLCLFTTNATPSFFHRFKTYFKHTFRSTGRKSLSRSARVRQFFHNLSLRKLISRIHLLNKRPKIEKLLKKGITLIGTGTLLKLSFGQWAKAEDVLSEIGGALSAKMLDNVSLENIKDFLEKHMGGTIKDLPFALHEIVAALKQEQLSIAKKEIIGYHSLDPRIFLLLRIYTLLYNEKRREKTSENFFYVRTFDSVKDQTKNLQYGLEHHNLGLMNDFSPLLMSFAPVLLNAGGYATALTRRGSKRSTKAIMKKIIGSICHEHKISAEACQEEIMSAINNVHTSLGSENILLQFIFHNYQTPPFQHLKKIVEKNSEKNTEKIRQIYYDIKTLDLTRFYVGYSQEFNPHLYWAASQGIIALYLDSAHEFQSAIKKPKLDFYSKGIVSGLQLRLVITEKFLQEGPRQYSVNMLDIYHNKNNYQSVEKGVKTEIQAILEKYLKE